MAFLSSKKVIHGDLAARNILLGTDLQPKIGDFGLSNQLQNYANYVQKGYDLVPWKQLAIESLQFMKFSLKSDVWAFGVVLFEILTLGQVPYPNYTYSELFIVALCQGERLPKPLFASDKMYKLMLDCWKHLPEDRPTFNALENALKILILENEMATVSESSTNSKIPEAKNDAATASSNEETARCKNAPQAEEQQKIKYTKRFNSDSSNLNKQPLPPPAPLSTPSPSSYVIDWKAVT